jgi:enamine deaminase RidA (YjgF/YER057c/UK114 family)
VTAFVVVSAPAEPSPALAKELQEYVKSQLAPYKYPRAVEFVTELPRTLTGKIQRFRLRHTESASGTGLASASGAAPMAFHQPDGWARPSGFANAVSASGRMVFVAGQVGWNPATCGFESDDFSDQVRQALLNVVAALGAAGARADQITRLTWYITDREAYLANRPKIGAHYRDIIGRYYPPMSVVVVRGLVEPRALVEIEATAVIGG